MESVGDYAILISSVMLFTTQHKRSIGKSETDNPKTTDTMIIPTTESTLRMTLMQLSETKLELTAVTEQRDRLAEECAKIRDVAERAINYLDQSYRDGFSDEVSELRYELAAVKGGADEIRS